MEKSFKVMTTLMLSAVLAFTGAISPASAKECKVTDVESIRALLVPITRLSAHQGRNSDENQAVLSEIKIMSQSSKSIKLKKSLKTLEGVIREGGQNPGSTEFWGYREGSAWKTYKKALTLTQTNGC